MTTPKPSERLRARLELRRSNAAVRHRNRARETARPGKHTRSGAQRQAITAEQAQR